MIADQHGTEWAKHGRETASNAAEGVRGWMRPAARRPYAGDVAVFALFAALCVAWTATSVMPITSFMRGDWPTFFLPNYAFLGARLRAFDIPGWNPHQFAGLPFAGDPESGWSYVPAMLTYALFSPDHATIMFIVGHVLLAAAATYALGRLLGLDRLGSFVAGTTLAFAWVATASSHMTLAVQVVVWLMVGLIGLEYALQTAKRGVRLWGWLIAGIGISQMLAAWLGQGAYYGLLVLGSWTMYRAGFGPLPAATPATRLRHVVANGLGAAGTGLALSAAGLLPRFDAVARSNLAGAVYTGRSAWADRQTGYAPGELVQEVAGGYTGSLWWYAGAVATALALAAPIVARRWPAMPYFALLAIGSAVLALSFATPLSDFLAATVPFFERLHQHAPERILILYAPAIALLAGATVSHLGRRADPRWTLAAAAAPVTFAALAGAPWASGLLSQQTIILAASAGVLILLAAVLPASLPRFAVPVAIALLAVWDPAGRIVARGFIDESRLEHSLQGSLTDIKGNGPDTEILAGALGSDAARDFLESNGPAAFLKTAHMVEPSRYAGYDPDLLDVRTPTDGNAPELGYRDELRNPWVNRLLVFNWATWFGLDDVQGYNPVQVQRYVEYIDALNGNSQEYHEADILPSGLASPLLDLLNLRYVVVPALPEVDPPRQGMIAVYTDASVRIYENPGALPRAWLVHEARQTAPKEALALLADRHVDASQTALVEAPPPPLHAPAYPEREDATILSFEPDRMVLRVIAETPGLLVLSEVWDPGWSATASGKASPVLAANHIMRAIPVPAGEHIVELRFDPPLLYLGITLTLASLTVILAAAILASRADRRREPQQTSESGRR